MKDVDKAREIVRKTAGEIGLEKDTFEQAERLLDDYDKERENLFRKMIEKLGKSDLSDLMSEWKDLCDKGKDQLRKINDISPGNGVGAIMVGLFPFQSGEFKIWDQNAKGEIAHAAVDMNLIYQANLQLVQAWNEELKEFMSEKKDLLDLAEGRFGATKDVLAKMVTLLHAYVKVEDYTGKPSLLDPFKDFGKFLLDNFRSIQEAAKKKRALVKVLVTRIGMIQDVRDKLDLDAIDGAYRSGESAASSLQGVGKDSPYDAEDWYNFGKECSEALKGAKELAQDQSRQVFELLANRLKEETAKSIEALTDDAVEQERWNDALAESFNSIAQAVENEQSYLDGIVEGPMRQAIAADWNIVAASVKGYMEDWVGTVGSIQESLRGE